METNAPALQLETLPQEFGVCKLAELPVELLEDEFCFVGKTDAELSVVCETAHVPHGALVREDGWSAMRVCGELDFALVGILSRITGALAAAQVPVFAVSTYDTDYVLVKSDKLQQAIEALESEGYVIRR